MTKLGWTVIAYLMSLFFPPVFVLLQSPSYSALVHCRFSFLGQNDEISLSLELYFSPTEINALINACEFIGILE